MSFMHLLPSMKLLWRGFKAITHASIFGGLVKALSRVVGCVFAKLSRRVRLPMAVLNGSDVLPFMLLPA